MPMPHTLPSWYMRGDDMPGADFLPRDELMGGRGVVPKDSLMLKRGKHGAKRDFAVPLPSRDSFTQNKIYVDSSEVRAKAYKPFGVEGSSSQQDII